MPLGWLHWTTIGEGRVTRDSESYEERAEEATKAPDEGADQQHEGEPTADDEQSSRAEK
jgi:hypothetical protein